MVPGKPVTQGGRTCSVAGKPANKELGVWGPTHRASCIVQGHLHSAVQPPIHVAPSCLEVGQP